jgi:phosphatidylglycerophosphatase A
MDAGAFSNVVLAYFIGGWEVVLLLSIICVLIGATKIPDLLRGLRAAWQEFKRATQDVSNHLVGSRPEAGLKQFCADLMKRKEPGSVALDYAAGGEEQWWEEMDSSFILWLAQGFGVGRIRFAPGTFGSLVGVLWFFVLLLASSSFWVYGFYTILGIGLSIWACGAAERILKQTDPSSVVLDEIISLPLCFAGWVAILFFRNARMPTPEFFVSSPVLPLTLFVFAAFRVFDILKPWPVRQSQRLPGGWGVTIDDILAAVYVNLVFLAVYGANALLHSQR